MLAAADLPALLRVGDALRIPVQLVPLTRDGAGHTSASATSDGAAVVDEDAGRLAAGAEVEIRAVARRV